MESTDLAEQVLKEALAIAPSDVAVNRQLAYLYVSLNRGPEAEAPLKVVAEKDKDPNARLLLAEYYRASGRQPLALQVLDELAKDPAMFAVARGRKGAILYASGQKREAYDAVEEVLKKDARNSVALLQKASFLLADHDLDQALKLAQIAAESDPQAPGAPLTIGRIQVARGELDEAITAYNDVLKLAPKYMPAQLELARLSLLAGRPGDALSFAANVLATEPRNADAILFKARALMMQGNVAAADEPMKLLATSFPTSPAVQAQLGTLYFQKHDFNAARAAYERALKGDPVNLEALTELTALDFSEKKGENARARIDAVLTSQPNTTPLLLLAARTYNTLGDHARAEQTASRILELDPSSLEAYLFLGQLYASQNRLDEAIAKFEEVAKRKPKLVAAPTQIGILLELSNKRQEAAKWYEQALSIDKQAAIAANNLAMIYVDTGGNLDMAVQLAQTAKQQLPEQPRGERHARLDLLQEGAGGARRDRAARGRRAAAPERRLSLPSRSRVCEDRRQSASSQFVGTGLEDQSHVRGCGRCAASSEVTTRIGHGLVVRQPELYPPSCARVLRASAVPSNSALNERAFWRACLPLSISPART